MKVCTKCKVEKEVVNFYKDIKGKNGLSSICKLCINEYKKQWNLHNPEYNKKYYLNNKDEIKENQKQYQLNNPEKSKKYYLDNKEKINTNKKKYRSNNPEKTKKENKKFRLNNPDYNKNRKLIDPLFKLSCNTRNLIRMSIKGNGYSKKSKTYDILGCSYEDFKQHLENQFTEGMTWDNQGLWHLDHIYPVSRAIDEEHLIKLNHYTNFQPLWAIDNLRKGNKI